MKHARPMVSLAALLLTSPVWAQTRPAAPAADVPALPFPELNNARLSELAAQLVIVHNVPSVAIAVVDRNGVRALGVAGVRKVGEPERLQPEDVMHLGSCGKAFTALLAGRLADRGKLSLDAPVASYLQGATLDPAFDGLSLLDLLRHRSGIASAVDSEQLPFLRAGAADPAASRAALASRLLASPPTGPRGAFAYSNSGYAIVGHVLERVAGRPFESLVVEEVFAPLSVTTAGFGAPGTFGKVLAPYGHSRAFVPVPPGPLADNPPGLAPAGTMHMSLRDWGRLCAVFLGGGPEGFLRPETLRRLTSAPAGVAGTDADPAYAAGWGRTSTRGRPTLTHAGSNTMWFSQVLLFTEDGWGILVATNAAPPSGQRACTDAAKELVALSTAPSK